MLDVPIMNKCLFSEWNYWEKKYSVEGHFLRKVAYSHVKAPHGDVYHSKKLKQYKIQTPSSLIC